MKHSILHIILFFTSMTLAQQCTSPERSNISYNQDIRPILNQHCLACHGGVRQMGGFSLLFAEEALDTTDSGKRAIVPGNHRASELYRRITATDPELRMPPESDPLPPEDVKRIAQWIDAGAPWEVHWAYVAPDPKQQLPTVETDWIQNEIDQFVWAGFQKRQLAPEPPAHPADLLRRVSLDLIGLPPTDVWREAFLQNKNLSYENLVDSLLQSPHFGEHWAAMWLDLARYGDSQGYQKDHLRPHIWRYRDWVIDAFNRDLPFDQFTIEQLAGDLLPTPTDQQILATAFHRNTNTNDEGGTDDEEFRTAAVIDRLNTTFEVWQGTSMQCVQCHSHPYDPFRHEEFYQGLAFFNNTADQDLTSEYPRRSVLSPAQLRQHRRLTERLAAYRQAGDTLSEDFTLTLQNWLAVQPGPVPVMQELGPDTARVTRMFERGNWLALGDTVQPGMPDVLPPLVVDRPANRLDLAHWLISEHNPLTARVMVNRFWAQLFGNGLVRTLEDFGSQGSPPSHPALLDWLAIRWVCQHHWRIKPLLRDMVLSATYRQAASSHADKWAQDPGNRWLARGPRVRLSAEQIRDQALAVSGLLSNRLYGPSVMPYQPEGVWDVIRQVARWETSPGEDRYRRAVYTLIRKTSPYPSFLTFDATSREFCVSRRVRTNTPLQALVTLNDPVYVEAARALAARMATHSRDPAEQISFAYEQALLRPPDDFTLTELSRFYYEALERYRTCPEDTDDPAGAARFNVANVLLNLDEVMNK